MRKTILFLSLIIITLFPACLYAAEKLGFDEARDIALAREPGKVVETYIKGTPSRKIYKYLIMVENGSIIEVEVDGNSGKIIEHKIEKVGSGVELPEAKISLNAAREIAKNYADEAGGEDHPAYVTQTRYTLLYGEPIYDIVVSKRSREYEVYINAMSGEVISAEEKKTGGAYFND